MKTSIPLDHFRSAFGELITTDFGYPVAINRLSRTNIVQKKNAVS
ncbi:hypothetical protein [Sporosarcina sp. NPDC096371]